MIGPNGAGKSSLLNVISGLYRPDRGRVWLGAQSFTHVPTVRLVQHGVARTFQNLAVFKGFSVLDNVLMGLAHRVRAGFLRQIAGSPLARRIEAENRAAAEDVIGFLRLDHVRDRAAGTLPYGLQKRVELARALVARPSLLLLDEPFAGVTLGEKQELAAHVRNARDSYGATIILIEHDIGVVMGLSDRVAVLDYGRKIAGYDGFFDLKWAGIALDDDGRPDREEAHTAWRRFGRAFLEEYAVRNPNGPGRYGPPWALTTFGPP